MKKSILFFLILSTLTSWGQKDIKPTDEFIITGQIEAEIKFNISDLGKFERQNIDDLIITNHLGEIKGTAKNLHGILMKDILNSIKFKTDSPRILSEFYITFVASDGYKAVFSWNEIFNTPTGQNLYLITEKEGKKMNVMDERILIVTTTDFKTGRRYIKGLSKIIIGRVD